MKRNLFTCVLLLASTLLYAQQRKKNESPERTTNQKNVNVQKKNSGYGKSGKRSKAVTDSSKTADTATTK